MTQEQAPIDAGLQAAFRELVGGYVAEIYRLHPTQAAEDGWRATAMLGLGRVDAQALAQEIALIRACQARLGPLPPERLGPALAHEAQIFAAHLEGRAFELLEQRRFARDPTYYTEIIQDGLLFQAFFEYPGSSLESRLQATLRQLADVPGLAQDAAGWLQALAPEAVEQGLDELAETRAFIETGLAPVYGAADGAAALPAAAAGASRALLELEAHLRRLDAAPGARPSFALGETLLARRMRLVHRLALPPEQPFAALLAQARAGLALERQAFDQAAALLNPALPSREVWAGLQKQHPPAGQVAQQAQAMMAEVVAFLRERRLFEIPDDELVQVRPAPACLLHWGASMWQSGPFEAGPAPPAIFFISDPGGLELAPGDAEAILQSLPSAELWSTVVHEAYPGHFLQGYALKQVKKQQVDPGERSLVAISGLFQSFAFVEGWAHYCEQLLREQGFLADAPPPERLAYQMGQRADALLRLCRTITGIELHCQRMSLAQAAAFFETQALLPRLAAEIEAQRAISDPDTILYAPGKLAILARREAEQQRLGPDFRLGAFHERLLRGG